MWASLTIFFIVIFLVHERAEGAASICVTEGDAAVPCELSFETSCLELLSSGEVTTNDILRDDATNGGCILCVPPGGEYVGPNPCPMCECMDGQVSCSGLAGTYLSAEPGTAPCPPSEYGNFTDFTATTPSCSELPDDCGLVPLPVVPNDDVPVVPVDDYVVPGDAKGKKQKDKSTPSGDDKKKQSKEKKTKGEKQ